MNNKKKLWSDHKKMKSLFEGFRDYAEDEPSEESEEEFFDDLLFGEEEELNELGFLATAGAVALGGILGVLVWKGAGKARNIAGNVIYALEKTLQQRARQAAAQMDKENQQFILEAFQNDEQLLSMLARFDELTQVVAKSKGQRSPELQQQRKELKEIGPQISQRLREIQQDVGGDTPSPTRPLSDTELQRQRRNIQKEGNQESAMYDSFAKKQGYDPLASAETRASDRESGRNILQSGIDEIEEIALAAQRGEDQSGYEKILDIVHRVSMSYETDEDE